MAQRPHATAEEPEDGQLADDGRSGSPSSNKNFLEDDLFLMTPPMERLMNDRLVDYLRKNGAVLSSAEKQRRAEALNKLRNIVQDWIKCVYEAKGLSKKDALLANAEVFTFGSYYLGVDYTASDIDAIIVCPSSLDRNRDVFGLPHSRTGEKAQRENVLVEILKRTPEVENLLAVPDAFVPVVKFRLAGIQIDLISAFLPVERVPADMDLSSGGTSVLKGMDDASSRGLNGARLCRKIMWLVPDKENFRVTLRAVKLWARRRGIYSNMMGYLGGVSWTIMTAYVCMTFRSSTPPTLLFRFFQLYYGYWDWPRPVVLAKPEQDEANLGLREWNPELYATDRRHFMPVITPVYPATNTTHNVNFSTFKVILDEFARGYEHVLNWLGQPLHSTYFEDSLWRGLFEEIDFGNLYKTFLQIEVSATDCQTELRWKALVESRLRHLLLLLETLNLKQIHLYPFDSSSCDGSKHSFFLGIDTDSWRSNQAVQVLDQRLRSTVNQWIVQELDWQRDPITMMISFRVTRQPEHGVASPDRYQHEHGPRGGRNGKGGKKRRSGQQQHYWRAYRPDSVDLEKPPLEDREQHQITSVSS